MVRDGWIVIALDTDETARAIGEEIMYLGKTVGNWRQVCVCMYKFRLLMYSITVV
jgi:hypothetical protein